MPSDYEKPLCSKDAAKLLSLSPRTLDQWRWKGLGPAYHKVNRQVRYFPSDIRSFLDRNRWEPGSASALAT